MSYFFVDVKCLDIDGGTDIGAGLSDADLFVVDDGANGTNRKCAMSRIKTYVGAAAGAFSIDNLDIDGGTDIGAALADDDLFIVDDGGAGTNRKCAMSRLKTYIGAGAADDITEGDGAVTINTTSGSIGIGTNTTESNDINIGTGGVARTITIGNDTGATALALTSGTGSMTLTSSASTNNALELVSDSITTANAFSISADALTSGSALDITSSSSNKSSGSLVNIAQTGATTTQEAVTLAVSTTATTHASAGVASFTGDAMTTGKAITVSADALTSGSALDITSSSAGKTTGALVNIAQTGATTTQEAVTLAVSTTATTNASAGVASFTGNDMTAGNAVDISTTALTTGSALKITSNSSARSTALEVASGVMVMTPQNINTNITTDTTTSLPALTSSVVILSHSGAASVQTFNSIGDGINGQVLHILFSTEAANQKIVLDFGANLLYTGGGTARNLEFSISGQSATLIFTAAFTQNSVTHTKGWRIINTGATVS